MNFAAVIRFSVPSQKAPDLFWCSAWHIGFLEKWLQAMLYIFFKFEILNQYSYKFLFDILLFWDKIFCKNPLCLALRASSRLLSSKSGRGRMKLWPFWGQTSKTTIRARYFILPIFVLWPLQLDWVQVQLKVLCLKWRFLSYIQITKYNSAAITSFEFRGFCRVLCYLKFVAFRLSKSVNLKLETF